MQLRMTFILLTVNSTFKLFRQINQDASVCNIKPTQTKKHGNVLPHRMAIWSSTKVSGLVNPATQVSQQGSKFCLYILYLYS